MGTIDAPARPSATVIAAPRRLAVAAVAVLALVAALLGSVAPVAASVTPAAARAGLWLLDAALPVPAGATLVDHLDVAGVNVVRSQAPVPHGVSADVALEFHALGGAAGDAVRLDSGVASTAADSVWSTTRGERAVVALIDTGVAPVPALEGAVAGEIDFSGTGGGDPYGHGTFMASLIAGRGPVAPGVAPGTGILSLKVGDTTGSTDLYTVLSALQWLNGPGRAAGIRVVALALGVDRTTPAAELLDRAVGHLASRGLLVVTAAGNDGPGNLTSPASAVGSFSVGAVDDRGTAHRSDDVAASFSSTGADRAGAAQPDAVASGVGVVGSIPAGSIIATTYPEATTPEGLFRGSGSSMSTAFAAGVAALASSARPDLDGAALAAALRAGAGALDAPAAMAAAAAAPQGPGTPTAPGASNAGNGRGRADGSTDRWEHEAVRWGAVRWGAVRWGAVRWGAVRWGAVRWAAVRWAGDHWGNADWDMGAWDGVRWGSRGWEGERWSTDALAAVRWSAVRWSWMPGA